jgi:hypothetical protein
MFGAGDGADYARHPDQHCGHGLHATSATEMLYCQNFALLQVMEQITRGILINIVGMGSTLIGISTLVGLLVAKTLSNASVNPFMASAAAGYNPVLALDVFLVQVRVVQSACCSALGL